MKFGENHIGKDLFYEKIDQPNKANSFHKDNVYLHSNKKLKTLESTLDLNQGDLYKKYY